MEYLLAVYFNDFKKLKEVFGFPIIEHINHNLVEKFKEITVQLLSRHEILTKEIDLEKNYFAVTFKMSQDDILTDHQEQMKTLEEVGEKMIRRALIEEFGEATGRSIKFKIQNLNIGDNLKIDGELIEREIDQSGFANREYKKLTDKEKLLKIIEQKEINTYLQPIVKIKDQEIYGYEALTRGPTDSELFSAGKLFSTASYYCLRSELELAAVESALDNFLLYQDIKRLFVNISPDIFLSDKFDQLVLKSEYEKLLPKLIIEFTEHMPLEVVKEVTEKAERFREKGAKFALDDTGCGFFDFKSIIYLRPEIVKLCITVVNKADKGVKLQQEIEKTIDKIVKSGSTVLAEGIERESQLDFLAQTKTVLAQGYYFKKPFPITELNRS